jgi:hypothetical protein
MYDGEREVVCLTLEQMLKNKSGEIGFSLYSIQKMAHEQLADNKDLRIVTQDHEYIIGISSIKEYFDTPKVPKEVKKPEPTVEVEEVPVEAVADGVDEKYAVVDVLPPPEPDPIRKRPGRPKKVTE